MWRDPRSLLTQLLVVAVAEIYALVAVSAPSSAFQVSSTTGYARYVSQAAQQAYVAAHRAQVISTLAPAMSAAGAGSVALRMVAGPIGWASLGVTAGLVIAGMLYTDSEIQSVKNNAATAAGVQPVISINGQTYSGTLSNGCGATPTVGCQQWLYQPNGMSFSQCVSLPVPTSANPPAGWTAWPVQWMQPGGEGTAACNNTYSMTYNGANAGNLGSSQPGTPSTQHVQDYLTSLPSSDTLAPEKQTDPAGTTNPAPSGSSSTTDQPVSPTEMTSQVGPASSVPTGAAVVDPNAPPTQTVTQNSSQTSTTTTTTNPDGSTTDTTTASVSCSQGSHNSKTFGEVLQDHYDQWSASGLLGTLNLLKNLTWPTTYPTYTLQSTIFGTLSFNFNQWAGVIDALRVLVIAGAGFAAYRIIFVGG